MKTLTSFAAFALLAGAISFAVIGCKSNEHDHSNHAHGSASTVGAKPYPLKKCIVSDEAFEHGTPYTFVRDGQEIKLCCKDCLADFDKEPAKYMQKLSAAK